jgi:hypothetical protein
MKSVTFAPLTSANKHILFTGSEVRRDCSKMWNTKSDLSDGFGSATDSSNIVKLRSGHVKLCFIAGSLTSLGSDGIISSFYAFLALIPWFSTGSMVSLIQSFITYQYRSLVALLLLFTISTSFIVLHPTLNV